MIRYRGRVGGGAAHEQYGRSPFVMLLISSHRRTRTEEEAPRLRRLRAPVVRRRYRDAGVPPVVHVRPGVPHHPSQCDREAIVLGCALTLTDPRTPRRAGERREGPASSWWRAMLGEPIDIKITDEY